MAAPSATAKPDVALADHYLLLLAFLLSGYAMFGKLVAYIGMPPLFIGEVTLFIGCLIALRTGCLAAALATPPSFLLGVAMAWVMARTLPNFSEYGFNALRDSVLIIYGAYAFIVIAVLLQDGRRIATLLKYYTKFVRIFIPASPFLIALSYYPSGAIYFIRAGELAVHLAGATVFALAGFVRLRAYMVLALVAALMMCVSISRGAMVAYCVPVILGMVLLGRTMQLARIVGIGVLIIGVAYGAETVFFNTHVAQRNSVDRTVSVRQIVENAASIFTQSGNQTEGTKQWRLEWWNIIIQKTIHGPYFWTGRGFGVNLADADGFWDGDHPDAPPLRSPHNAHMTILARAGVPGAVLWGSILVSWFVFVGGAMLSARYNGEMLWSHLFVAVTCYVVAALVNASFDVALEGPMQGIWFWSLIGFGIGSAMIYRVSGSARGLQTAVARAGD